jgi:hypothetical protein
MNASSGSNMSDDDDYGGICCFGVHGLGFKW